MKDLYEDIINRPHHVSKARPQMSELERAAQFALSGAHARVLATAAFRPRVQAMSFFVFFSTDAAHCK